MKESSILYFVFVIAVLFLLFWLIKKLYPSYTFYYTEDDLNINKVSENSHITHMNLYDKSHQQVLGSGYFNVSTLKTQNGTYDIEHGIFFLDNNDSISFTITQFNKNIVGGLLNSGNHTFSITGGSGKFANSTGVVEFNVSGKLREVKVYM
jgi:hypothetical protein